MRRYIAGCVLRPCTSSNPNRRFDDCLFYNAFADRCLKPDSEHNVILFVSFSGFPSRVLHVSFHVLGADQILRELWGILEMSVLLDMCVEKRNSRKHIQRSPGSRCHRDMPHIHRSLFVIFAKWPTLVCRAILSSHYRY